MDPEDVEQFGLDTLNPMYPESTGETMLHVGRRAHAARFGD